MARLQACHRTIIYRCAAAYLPQAGDLGRMGSVTDRATVDVERHAAGFT
ncbi:MAG: hypothetical protein ACXWMU_00085 [Candidatus Limnocylindrales bacterium]